MGYLGFILATMLVLPLVASAVDRRGGEPLPERLGKWFIFFGVGVRLVVAGLNQVANPAYTGGLLGLDAESLLIVQELGLANVVLGVLALASILGPVYRVPGTAGAVFMGLAGLLHLGRLSPSTPQGEQIALWSDLWIFAVAIVYLGYRWTSRGRRHAQTQGQGQPRVQRAG